MMNTKFVIIGAGNMGTAILEGIFSKHLARPDLVMVTNRSGGKLEYLREKWPIRISYTNSEAAGFGEVIILCVKPTDVKSACEQISRRVCQEKLIVSVAAGIEIHSIKKWLGAPSQPVVRIMPNTPVQIGVGISGWIASKEVNHCQQEIIRRVLGTLGLEVKLEEEDALDQITAISGSGPAYVYYLAEILTNSAKSIGLSEKVANELVLQTVYGAAAMMRANGKTPKELRAAVTSRGGTTEAAIGEFMKGGLEAIIERGVQAAHQRGKELGKMVNGVDIAV